MTALADLFPGFAEQRIATEGAEIFLRIGGSGPPLLLLHGYPQTHVCWHRVASELAREFTVIAMDLRGYGASSAPPGDPEHHTYSKRIMAEDCLAVMRALGHDRFSIMGHDRGARAAYRLALDHPQALVRLVLLDILPTLEVWERMEAGAALKMYHWLFLAQPHPMPETLISGAPDSYTDHTLKSWTRDKSLDCLAPEALRHYRALLRSPERVHAVCEDYRAGATCDRAADAADRAAGKKIACPTLLLWGSDFLPGQPLEVWKSWCRNVTGHQIISGHFLAEENPAATLAAVLPFLRAKPPSGS